MSKRRKILLVITLIATSVKFWVGIYEDGEFFEKRPFLKHRPIWKTYFYSPRGMSDMKTSDMSPEKQIEQNLFDEFILENK